MKVTLQKKTAAGGEIATQVVNVEATVTVAAVLKAAGVEPDDKLKLMVGDTPAEINTEVTDGAVVTMTERPAGS